MTRRPPRNADPADKCSSHGCNQPRMPAHNKRGRYRLCRLHRNERIRDQRRNHKDILRKMLPKQEDHA